MKQAGGQCAVHLPERQVGQKHLEPLRVGPGVAEGGNRGAGCLEELGCWAARGNDSVEVVELGVESHMSPVTGYKPLICRFTCRLKAPSNPPIALKSSSVTRCSSRPSALEELGADHLQEQGDAVSAAMAGNLAGDARERPRRSQTLGTSRTGFPPRAGDAHGTWDGESL